jgi:hypothetical protein
MQTNHLTHANHYHRIAVTVEVSKPEMKISAVILLHLIIAVKDMLDEAKSDTETSHY